MWTPLTRKCWKLKGKGGHNSLSRKQLLSSEEETEIGEEEHLSDESREFEYEGDEEGDLETQVARGAWNVNRPIVSEREQRERAKKREEILGYHDWRENRMVGRSCITREMVTPSYGGVTVIGGEESTKSIRRGRWNREENDDLVVQQIRRNTNTGGARSSRE